MREHPLWQRRDALPEDEGIGVALGFWPGGLEPAAAICRLDADGKLTVVTAAADMSGIENAFVAIAAETFGLAEDSVRVTTGDTAERALRRRERRLEGHLHVRARDRARRRRGARAAAATSPRAELEIAPEDLELVDGEVRPVGAPGRAIEDRGPRAPRRSRSAARTSRSRATAASPRSAARRAPPRTSRTCAWTARPAA